MTSFCVCLVSWKLRNLETSEFSECIEIAQALPPLSLLSKPKKPFAELEKAFCRARKSLGTSLAQQRHARTHAGLEGTVFPVRSREG